MKYNPLELKAARMRKGISQKELASALGKTSVNYCLKENGKRSLSLDEVIAISETLQLTDTEIIGIFFG